MTTGILEGAYTVLTPEYVEFEFTLAGLYSRFLAWVLDSLITALLAVALAWSMTLASLVLKGFGVGLGLIAWFLLDWGYFIVLEGLWSGQTVGKRALGLRVIQETGVRAGFLAIALRNLVRPLDRLPVFYLVGGAAALFSEHHQRLGDMLAGTIVVRERRQRLPSALSAPDLPGLGIASGLATLPQRLSAEERDVLVSAVLRREELALTARLELFSAIAARLEREHGVKRPPHLSHEKWVLALTALVVAPPPGRAKRGI